jgi:hypothetical protein
MVDVMIQLSPPAGQDESVPAQDQQLAELRRVLKGYRVEPLHPGSTDRSLSSYYCARVPDMKSASEVIEAARGLSSVTAAYVKPKDELP